MPVTVQKRGDKYRVVETNTGRLAKNKAGTPLDGGGHKARDKALSQSRAVNSK